MNCNISSWIKIYKISSLDSLDRQLGFTRSCFPFAVNGWLQVRDDGQTHAKVGEASLDSSEYGSTCSKNITARVSAASLRRAWTMFESRTCP